MQGFDLSTISDCYIGNNQVSEIWLGQTKIWPTHDYSQDYLTIVSLEDNNDIGWEGSGNNSMYKTISVSTDNGNNWAQYTSSSTSSTTGTILATLNTGDKLLIKGNNNIYSDLMDYYNYFISSGNFNIEGNIMSLIYGDNFIGQTTLPTVSSFTPSTFGNLFYACSNLISAKNLILPATTLTKYCYWCMFSLCTSLITPPELPATTLADGCYGYMFEACNSLTTAPTLRPVTLTRQCYYQMFQGCILLNYIKCLATDLSAFECLYNWVYGVASSGTFVKASSATWPSGVSGIPNNWVILNN